MSRGRRRSDRTKRRSVSYRTERAKITPQDRRVSDGTQHIDEALDGARMMNWKRIPEDGSEA